MQKQSLKLESTRKTEQNKSYWNLFDYGQSQRSTVNGWRVLTWRVWRHLKAYVAGREAQQARGARGWAWELAREARGGYWRCVAARGARAREVETSAGVWRHVWCSFWPFLVGFCSGLVVLSFCAFSLAIEWAEHWYPRVVGIVGVTAVARFWQWLLDEGEGSGRTPEMSTGTKKSEEWLWYHVNNIKW